MIELLIFALTLLLAVMLSRLAERSVLSTEVISLAAGFIAGKAGLDLIRVTSDAANLFTFIEIVMFVSLYTDGMKIPGQELASVWRLSGRAILLGMPLTIVAMGILARSILGITWMEALLVAAVLSPTDPVFASRMLSEKRIPRQLRRMLNVESGMNDGLALPIVLLLLALLRVEPVQPLQWGTELLVGSLIGIAVPWVVLSVLKTPLFATSKTYRPLLGVVMGLLVYSLAGWAHGNRFLAAFFAGITVASTDGEVRQFFVSYGEPLVELLKLGVLMLFGASLSLDGFTSSGLAPYLFALAVLFIARPLALNLSMAGSSLDWRQRLVVGWLGPRGFASVLYGLLVLGSGIRRAGALFSFIAVVVTLSILIHSTTNVLVPRWFPPADAPEEPEKQGE